MLFFYVFIILAAICSCQSSECERPSDTPVSQTVHLDPHFLSKTAFPNSLNTPTHVLPIDGGASIDDRGQLYVVVDCWNNRVLYTSSLTLPLKEWKALITNIGTPHSAAVTRFEDKRGGGSGSDKFWIVVEATALNSLTCLAVRIRSGNVEVLYGHSVAVEGERPHKTIFIEDYKSFFSLSSVGPLLYLTRLKVESGGMEQPVSIPLPFLEGLYARSFTHHSNKFYFASHLGIVVAELVADGVSQEMNLLKVVEVPGEMEYLNDIYFSNERRVYITWTHKNSVGSSTGESGGICVMKGLAEGECVGIKDDLGLEGTPYYLSTDLDGSLLVTEITESSGIVRFREDCGEGEFAPLVCQVERMQGSFEANSADLEEKWRLMS
ncbi:hypothetical protein TrLO_g10944 [Triparma laevis f. longispina]|uniref:Uncharacterized protein n=1 Tax=Triparma laevis f. longispina TaxID=1714387 RepID=A0A9W6ZQR4_9STRA|nr:hypothetical protein TrLO_g10944 [Triparma laevis f. longispina]